MFPKSQHNAITPLEFVGMLLVRIILILLLMQFLRLSILHFLLSLIFLLQLQLFHNQSNSLPPIHHHGYYLFNLIAHNSLKGSQKVIPMIILYSFIPYCNK